jgi:hypothetical protein
MEFQFLCHVAIHATLAKQRLDAEQECVETGTHIESPSQLFHDPQEACLTNATAAESVAPAILR